MDLFIATLVFIIGAVFQVQIGHGIYEKGRNNLKDEVAEFTQTKNITIFLLIYLFPLLHSLTVVGYRPQLLHYKGGDLKRRQ